MDKRQGALAALLGVVTVAALAFWWMTQKPEAPATPEPEHSSSAIPMTSTVSAPLAGTPQPTPEIKAAESDAVALGEEVIDQLRKEGEELASRATDLEAQVQDGEALIALKEKQIRDLESALSKAAGPQPPAKQ